MRSKVALRMFYFSFLWVLSSLGMQDGCVCTWFGLQSLFFNNNFLLFVFSCCLAEHRQRLFVVHRSRVQAQPDPGSEEDAVPSLLAQPDHPLHLPTHPTADISPQVRRTLLSTDWVNLGRLIDKPVDREGMLPDSRHACLSEETLEKWTRSREFVAATCSKVSCTCRVELSLRYEWNSAVFQKCHPESRTCLKCLTLLFSASLFILSLFLFQSLLLWYYLRFLRHNIWVPLLKVVKHSIFNIPNKTA